jgi:hypothetical protein
MEISGVSFLRVNEKIGRFIERLVCLESKVFTRLDYEKTFILMDVFFSRSNIFPNNQSLKLNIHSLCLSPWIQCLMRRHLFPADGCLFLLANMTDLQLPTFRTCLLPTEGSLSALFPVMESSKRTYKINDTVESSLTQQYTYFPNAQFAGFHIHCRLNLGIPKLITLQTSGGILQKDRNGSHFSVVGLRTILRNFSHKRLSRV